MRLEARLYYSITVCYSRAPTDCVQYFTGTSGNVKSFGFGGGQFLQSQYYTSCVRTEEGYCAIQWKESSSTSPDPFGIVGPTIATQAGSGTAPGQLCPSGFVAIPSLSMDGITGIPVPLGTQAFQSIQCGGEFGIEGQIYSAALVCE